MTKDLSAGEDVNEKDENGGTPLQVATYEGHKETVELLIANGADVNAKYLDDDTPLDWAIKQKHTEIADLLRKHGGKMGEELEAADK